MQMVNHIEDCEFGDPALKNKNNTTHERLTAQGYVAHHREDVAHCEDCEPIIITWWRRSDDQGLIQRVCTVDYYDDGFENGLVPCRTEVYQRAGVFYSGGKSLQEVDNG